MFTLFVVPSLYVLIAKSHAATNADAAVEDGQGRRRRLSARSPPEGGHDCAATGVAIRPGIALACA